MRVRGDPAARREACRATARRAFDEALARAGERRASPLREGPAVRRRGDPAPAGEGVPSAGEVAAGPPGPAPAEPGHTGSAGLPARHPPEPSLPELREAARAVPAAIWAGRLRDAPVVELAFGRALSIELRQVGAGVEVAVRADASLSRAARADLPALVRALQARGVAVVRAQVRTPSAGSGSGAVDARPPLR